jgi:hypothetical protein
VQHGFLLRRCRQRRYEQCRGRDEKSPEYLHVIALLGISHPGLVLLAMRVGTAGAAAGAMTCEVGLSAEDVMRLMRDAAGKAPRRSDRSDATGRMAQSQSSRTVFHFQKIYV